MKYVITMEASAEVSKDLQEEGPEAMGKVLSELMEDLKPEAIYFSTIRRLFYIVAEIDDPHVKLRNAFEALARFGKVTIDPVSTLEQFSLFVKQV